MERRGASVLLPREVIGGVEMKKFCVNRYRLRDDGACEVVTVFETPYRFDAGDMAERLNDGAPHGVTYKVEIFHV